MSAESDELQILRLHRTWAARHTLLWQLAILLLFAAAYFVLEEAGSGAGERAGTFVLLAALVLTAVIWQAVGGGVARIHMLLNGTDLETWSKPGTRSDRGPP